MNRDRKRSVDLQVGAPTGMGHLLPIKSHVHAEISVEQDQEMADRIKRAGTHGITYESAPSGTAGGR
jgi:hypothetical protein